MTGQSVRKRNDDCNWQWLPMTASLALMWFSCLTSAWSQDLATDQSASFGLGTSVGIEKVAEDLFLTPRLTLVGSIPTPSIYCDGSDACETQTRFGLSPALRFRIRDDPPTDTGILRKEDYSRPEHFVGILSFLEYGHRSEVLHGRLGRLGSVEVGHGTLVAGYHNVVSVDRHQLGAEGALHTAYGGAQLFVDHLLEPEVLGGRSYVRPWAFFDKDSWFHRLAVGMSVVTDIAAPLRLRNDRGATSSAIFLEPVAAETDATVFVGLDLEIAAVETETIRFTGYSDGNLHLGQGAGWHLGGLTKLQLRPDLSLSGRLEYRLFGAGYLPDYFGPLYEIDRSQTMGWGVSLPAPKLRVAASQPDKSRHGAYGRLTIHLKDWFQASTAYADAQGAKNSWLSGRLSFQAPGGIHLAGLYFHQFFDSLVDLAQAESTLILVQSHVPIWGPLFAEGRYDRQWQLSEDGLYEPVVSWNLGVGVSFTL